MFVDKFILPKIEVDNSTLEVVDSFCYLGDMISAGGGCELSSTVRVKSAWGKFRELLPILTSRAIPITTRGRVYSSCVRSKMLHGSENWALTQSSLARLERNDKAMIRWICNVKPDQIQQIRTETLLETLCIPKLEDVIRKSRLRWYGHVERSHGWISKCRSITVPCRKKPGRPKKTWEETIRGDLKKWHLTEVDPQDRDAWRLCVQRANPRPTPDRGRRRR